jgi:branched-chain amino acid transport system permease protein
MEQSVFVYAGINIMLALSLFVTMSAGQISLGHGAFMAVGAYVSSILTVKFAYPMPVACIGGAFAASLLGFFIGFPALRIKGIYLAVGTLGFGEIIEVILRNVEYIGGSSGFSGMSGTTLFNVVIGTLCVLAAVLHIHHSRLGWAFKAVEQDEVAAQSMGLNVTFLKICAFTISAGIAGIAGGYYAHYMFFIDPQGFGFQTSLLILFYVIFGGYQTPWGAVAGAFILTLLPEIFRGLDEWRMVIYGFIIVVMMAVRPQGLVSEKSVKRMRNFLRKRPKSTVSVSSSGQ